MGKKQYLILTAFLILFYNPVYSQYNHYLNLNVYSENIVNGSFFKRVYLNSIGGNLSYDYQFENNFSTGVFISYNSFDHIMKETGSKLSFTSFQPEFGYQIFLSENLIITPKFALGYSWFNLEGNEGNSADLQHVKYSSNNFTFTPNLSLIFLFEENWGITFHSSYQIVLNTSIISTDNSFEWLNAGGGLVYRF